MSTATVDAEVEKTTSANGSEQEHAGGSLDVVPTNALATILRADIDVQITTAKQYPRSIALFKKTALSMACLDEETAASCFYSLPRAGKAIEWPSVRLAEIAVSAWGNIRYGARVISDDGRIMTAQGMCHDMQTNCSATVEVRRRVTDKRGRRFSDDMIVVTGNAACSIAMRNAIFKVVPMAYLREVYLAARKTAIGDAKTLVNRRAEAIAHFAKMGVDEKRVLAVLGKGGIEEVGLDELATLRGLATAIKDGDTSVDEAFPPVQAIKPPSGDGMNGNGSGSKSDKLADKLAERSKGPEEEKSAQAETKPQQTETTAAVFTADASGRQDFIDDIKQNCDEAKDLRDLLPLLERVEKGKEFLGQDYAGLKAHVDAAHSRLSPKATAAAPVAEARRVSRAQLSSIRAWFAKLGFVTDEIREFLDRWNVATIESLTHDHAGEALAVLEKINADLLAAK